MEKILIEFMETIHSSINILQDEMGEGSGASKLTFRQFQYLDTVYRLGEPTITQIAGHLKITKASVTIGIMHLKRLGYVTKRQSQEDKRVLHVSLTKAGLKFVTAKHQALEKYGEFIEASLTADEARQLEATLTKLVKLFKKD